MNPVRLVTCGLLFVTAVVFIVRANLIFFRILDEVNAKRAANEQVSFLFVGLRLVEVTSEHGRLFPQDKKRTQMKTATLIGFALLLALVLASQYL